MHATPSESAALGKLGLSTHQRKLVRLREVLERAALGRTAVYDLISRGMFPKPIKVGRSSRWVDGEIDEWIEEQIRERGNAGLRGVAI